AKEPRLAATLPPVRSREQRGAARLLRRSARSHPPRQIGRFLGALKRELGAKASVALRRHAHLGAKRGLERRADLLSGLHLVGVGASSPAHRDASARGL